MRVLWFTNTSSLYEQGNHGYNGGGWISSLEELVKKEEGIDLAVSFFHLTDNKKVIRNGTSYYPVLKPTGKKSPIKTLVGNWLGKNESEKYISQLIDVIEDFKPDVIHVFGTEGIFCSVQYFTNIPVIIHLQGLTNAIVNTYFPPSQSKWDFLFSLDYLKSNIVGKSPFFSFRRMKKQALREESFLSASKYVMGRTDWDKSFATLYAPNAKYFHVDEVLRDVFYNRTVAKKRSTSSITLISTISPTPYKGIDVILKTAKLLTQKTGLHFEWKLVGIDSDNRLLRYFEKTFKIDHKKCNIYCEGIKTPEELAIMLENANLFIHPSYMDNSPNSICEAQIVGLPVIACNVGGVSSLIKHQHTGILLPSNGVTELIDHIQRFATAPDKFESIGNRSREIALERHCKNRILQDVIKCYKQILKINADTNCLHSESI